VSRVWVEDRSWRVPSRATRCRREQCPNPPVADLLRWTVYQGLGRRRTPWAYCADHLYGRRVEDGKVLCEVEEGSLAALRGWVE
jgi:hypothetical protein